MTGSFTAPHGAAPGGRARRRRLRPQGGARPPPRDLRRAAHGEALSAGQSRRAEGDGRDRAAHANEFVKREHELELRVSGEFIFVNSTRLRLDLDNYASFSRIITVFRDAGVGALPRAATSCRGARLGGVPEPAPGRERRRPGRARLTRSAEKLAEAKVTAFEIGPPSEVDEAIRQKSKEARQAHLLAVRVGDEGRHQVGAHGEEPEHQEDQARGAGHRRSDPERGDLADRADDDSRLRRVHVHAQRERLHLLGGARHASSG